MLLFALLACDRRIKIAIEGTSHVFGYEITYLGSHFKLIPPTDYENTVRESNLASNKTPFIASSPAVSPVHHPTLSAAFDGELR